jgi:hypothetical protein
VFEVIDIGTRRIRDSETGIDIRFRGQPDYQEQVVVTRPDGQSLSFGLGIGPKFPDRPFVVGDYSNPTIQIPLGSLRSIARFRNGTIEENTKFVRLILSGLSTVNRLWPLSTRNPFFYTNREEASSTDPAILGFVLPSEDEIALL